MRPLAALTDWTGWTPRRPFWLALGAAGLAVGLAALIEARADPELPLHRASFLLAALLVVPLAILGVRRLHDTGRSGLWMFLLLVPFGALPLLWMWAGRSERARRGTFTWKRRHQGGLALVLAAALLLGLRAFYQPFWVPSGSMVPALVPGDYLLVSRGAGYVPARGDVVVFRHGPRQADFVKRLVGLPGDRVELRAGRVILNGVPLPLAYESDHVETKRPQGPAGALPRCANDPVGLGGECRKYRARETLPEGRGYDVLDIGPGHGDTTAVFAVPPGQYFFLGDNRDSSLDSRFAPAVSGLGFVPAGAIIGPARRVLFSAAGSSLLSVWTWRPDRLLKAVE